MGKREERILRHVAMFTAEQHILVNDFVSMVAEEINDRLKVAALSALDPMQGGMS